MIGRIPAFLAATIIVAFGACVAAEGDAEAGRVADAGAEDTAGLSTFAYTCGSDTRVVANFRDSRLVWLFLPGRTVRLPQVESASGARYSDGSTTFWIKGRGARFETGESGPLDCAEDRRGSFIEDAKLRGNDLWAVGNEPPWMLELGSDSSVIYVGYERERHSFATPAPDIDPDARRTVWSGETGPGPIIIEVTGEECSDDMSGERFQVRVSLTLAGRLLRGCGQALH